MIMTGLLMWLAFSVGVLFGHAWAATLRGIKTVPPTQRDAPPICRAHRPETRYVGNIDEPTPAEQVEAQTTFPFDESRIRRHTMGRKRRAAPEVND